MKVLSFDVGTRTLSYCLLDHTPAAATTVHFWETIDVHSECGVSEKAKPTMKEDSEYVVNVLHHRIAQFWGAHVNAVIIEQQPAGGSNRFCSVRMKSISHVIHAFFYALQKTEQGGMGEDGAVVPVSFVSPSSKLVGMEKGETEEEANARAGGDRKTMGAKYRRNKKHAVDMVTALLETMDPNLLCTEVARATFAAAAPKQDDLADSFMLAYAFATKASKKRKRS